jgi:long-chain fatty acid transport protein
MNRCAIRAGALLLSAALAPTAFATDGYFAHGYGVKSQGMGGVGIALAQDTLASASNPAGTAAVGTRMDVGLNWFKPARSAQILDNGVPGANGRYDGNAKQHFFIPEFGYTRQLTATSAIGIAVYGNGGMHTGYASNPYAAFGATGKAGVDLAQVFVSPSYARKFGDHTVGVALNLAYQRFSAEGLGAFASISSDSSRLTNQGHDGATGAGMRLGWSGQVTPALTLGATWSSKINMGQFDRYRGLFAQGGGFDIPANYGLGLAWAAWPGLTVAADVSRINYSGVKSVGNPLANLFAGNALGSENGPGFGWRDITVFKAGVSYDVSRQLTLRAGYNRSGQPISRSETFFNILAPGVVQHHATLGATWKPASGGEWSVSYLRAPTTTVRGADSIPAPFGGGNANISLGEHALGIAYGRQL